MRPRTNERHRIFISSTDDLETRKYRIAAREVIESDDFSDSWQAVEMSEFTASASTPIEACKRQVLDCAVYLGLFGPFYGSINRETDLSYTEYEYTVAKNARRELGIFLLPEDAILNDTDYKYVIEQGKHFERQQDLKRKVREDHVIVEVRGDVEEFKGHLKRFLRNLSRKRLPAPTTPEEETTRVSMIPSPDSNPKTETKKIEELSYDNYRGAFSDLERRMVDNIERQLEDGEEEPKLHLKLLSVAMTFSWQDVIATRIPLLIKKYPSVRINLDILYVDAIFLSTMNLATTPINWARISSQREDDMRDFISDMEAKVRASLFFNARSYKNLPHWHGWLLNEDNLFMGRTTWEFPDDRANLLVGQSKYRYFDRETRQGQERIDLFSQWFHYYWNYSSTLVCSTDGNGSDSA